VRTREVIVFHGGAGKPPANARTGFTPSFGNSAARFRIERAFLFRGAHYPAAMQKTGTGISAHALDADRRVVRSATRCRADATLPGFTGGPLCAQARRLGAGADEVEDLCRSFSSRCSTPARSIAWTGQVGRFRGYLIGALRHRLSDHRARRHAQKRGGGVSALPLEEVDPASRSDDEREFDADWARALVAEAMRPL